MTEKTDHNGEKTFNHRWGKRSRLHDWSFAVTDKQKAPTAASRGFLVD